MSDIRQNPIFLLSKPPHKLSSKQVMLKNKPAKRSGRSRNKNNLMNTSFSSNTTTNNNNKPLKVVHISNPMKFQATAAEFRALVQGLTGRDAVLEWPEEHFSSTGNPHQVAAAAVAAGAAAGVDSANTEDQVLHQDHHQEVNLSEYFGPSDHLSFDYCGAFDGDFVDDDHQMVVLEDLRAFMADDDR